MSRSIGRTIWSGKKTRRQFLATGWQVVGAVAVGGVLRRGQVRAEVRSPNDRLRIGAIGMRYQGTVIARQAEAFGDVVAIADVDRNVREQARASFGSTPDIYEDYRHLLDRSDIDVVLIATPDHWHARMLIDACRAGKDVYVEKPLTLTVDEGKVVRRVVQETQRVVQVGSWQRSDARYRLAVEMVRAGRLGRLRRVVCATGPNPSGGPFPTRPVPKSLNWELWLGQAPYVPYTEERCHYTFRWWFEYAGGKITDWGAHDIDIAQWAIGLPPQLIEAEGTLPNIPNGYNVPTRFSATVHYPNDVQLIVQDEGRTGVLFEGEQGRIFVNRGTLSGAPVEQLKDEPLPKEHYRLYDFDNPQRPDRVGKLDAITNHMGNFYDCLQKRHVPISDVESQHRTATTCHLINLSIRLGRPLSWDAQGESVRNDDEANRMLARPQRAGYEVA
ncbi:MAG: oxidoreductase [Pirellulaceae bacterium]|nr:MAG: oxidoreductase [Pirellulaceae bacterium]